MKDCDEKLKWWQGSRHEWAYSKKSETRKCTKCGMVEVLWESHYEELGLCEDWRPAMEEDK